MTGESVNAETLVAVCDQWSKAPVELLVDQKMSDRAVRVYLLIRSYVSENRSERVAWPCQETLASRLGVDVRTVRRAVGELVDGGWVVKRQRSNPAGGQWRSNEYELRDHRTDLSGDRRTDLSGDRRTDLSSKPEPVEPEPVEPEQSHDTGDTQDRTSRQGKRSSAAQRDATFTEIWERWPRRNSRQATWKTWNRERREHAAALPDIIAGCLTYADAMRGKPYARGLKGFLEDEEWRDWCNGIPEWFEEETKPAAKMADLSGLEFESEAVS